MIGEGEGEKAELEVLVSSDFRFCGGQKRVLKSRKLAATSSFQKPLLDEQKEKDLKKLAEKSTLTYSHYTEVDFSSFNH